MRAWFRRNGAALAVIVLAGAALVGVQLGLPLIENERFQQAPIEVAKDEPVEVGGYTWTLVASGEFPHSSENDAVPEGLAVTAAIIQARPIAGAEPDGSCSADLISGTGPNAPRWLTLSDPRAFEYGVLEDSTTVCILDGDPFDLEVVYLTPEGTISDAVVELEVGAMGGTLVRFALTD
ncbi:MAG: hypothetical protein M3Y46_03085 [Actinomycetota bacterium]|nr:hypothetical protein [Actinomycetota bacterium]